MLTYSKYLSEASLNKVSSRSSFEYIKPETRKLDYDALQNKDDGQFANVSAESSKTWLMILKYLLVARAALGAIDFSKDSHVNSNTFNKDVISALKALNDADFSDLKDACEKMADRVDEWTGVTSGAKKS